jgi:hypothetical protein
MELVEEHRATYGLNRSLQALKLSKGTYYYRRHNEPVRRSKDAHLKERIVSIIKENPSYGYRRILMPRSQRMVSKSESITSASGGCLATTNWASDAACRSRSLPRCRG